MKKQRITLQELLSYFNALSEPATVAVKFQCQKKKHYTSFNEIRHKASPTEMEAPVSDIWIGKGDDGIVIELVPPKQYSMRIGKAQSGRR